ncbi:ATP-binding protein [Nonomuraea sp. NPDC050556]|uniref:ATP-binding protein n=1 Tax=Nonomuraea sp. NPDC050556 TaxID=3364369 RepID=UPI0037B89E6B
MPELVELLRSARVVTLSGAGGIGKTRLAGRVARAALGDFEDGVHLIGLAGIARPELVVSLIADTVGISPEPGLDRRETLIESLRYRHALLVLDNCEHLIEEVARVGHALIAAAPGLRLLATSREPLRIPGESIWRVPPLNGGEAVSLFARRAAEARAGFAVTEDNAEVVGQICAALDGMPLAIELAAARTGMMSVRQIADRLDDRFRLLTSRDRTAPARQRTLRSTVEWSYDLLDADEKMLLRRLSVFADGWALESAEQVCADRRLPEYDVLDLLAALVDKSLVAPDREVAGELRYRLLETVRVFAAERLAAAGEDAEIRRRLREHAIEQAERWYDEAIVLPRTWRLRIQTMLRYNAELDNLRAVLADCVESGDVVSGLRLCRAMRVAWGYRGQFDEGMAWIERLLALGTDGVPPPLLGRALVTYGDAALEQGLVTKAYEPTRAGLDLCEKAADRPFVAHALQNLGLLALHEGRGEEAAGLLDQAGRVAREIGDTYRESYVLATLAELASVSGDLRTALETGKAALDITVAGEHVYNETLLHQALGKFAELSGDHEAARRSYERSLQVQPELSIRISIPPLIGLGRLATAQGRYVEAHARLREALRLLAITGERLQLARALEACALLAHHRHDPARAGRLMATAEALREIIGCPRPAPTVDLLSAVPTGQAVPLREAVAGALADPPEQQDQHQEGPLTAREREIAQLIARGLTNRGIAEELFISPATAARHVANILAKLGFTSRAQVAVYVRDITSEEPGSGNSL